jgi:RNase H-like domain found in reverse transcriptase/Reverse transcriptase (RNA-dependent DNA polymerase)/Integrase zinc binding domain/Chromo (CHRromatin Organisation MOdifier) domain
LSNRQSMSIRVFLHTSSKRAEAPALLDSGATENFINEGYARWLRLPFKRLVKPRAIYNVDGTPNRKGHIRFYTDLEVRTGEDRRKMRFFLTDLGPQRLILGYPWFAAAQPRIDWARGWLDYDQLPVVLRTPNAHQFLQRVKNRRRRTDKGRMYVAYVAFPQKGQTTASKLAEQYTRPNTAALPDEYQRHRRVFGEKEAQRFPGPRLWDHAIELKPNAPATIPGKVYALTQKEQEALTEFIKEHLKKGYIQPSKSPYASSFFYIKKKDGKLRPVQDYRRVNEWTIKNRYPLPLIPELIARVKGASLFTKFDVRWGYNNVRIKDGDQWKAAFITNQGLYEPNVMFFGLTNSPATFQTMMNAIFAEEIREGWLTVYMDDMLIHTESDKRKHRELVHRVLDKLKKHDLFLKPEKCLFEQKEMEFLGVVLENGTIRMDPAKVKGVADWERPRTVRDVRAFLGFTGFYRYFIPGYSAIARPLIHLTKKATPFHWEAPQVKAFETLKTLMCRQPILRQPDYTQPFFLSTDASAYGVGAVLSQEGELNPRTKKPTQHPIAYYSATFTPTERNYDIYERELLAVLKALEHWRPHLAATEIPVTVLTDHANLTFWKNPKKVNRRVARWFATLQDYNLVIKHVPGKLHAAPDMLSRPPGADRGEEDNQDVVLLPPESFIRTTPGHEKGDTPEGRLTVPPDETLKRDILRLCHDRPTAGHPGRDQTLANVQAHYWWPGMRAWVANYVRGCATCQQSKNITHPRKVPLYRIPVPPEALPFQVVAMDLITQLPRCDGSDAILTIVDHGCSRAALFLPCATTITGEGVAKLYFENVYRWFGLPSKVISDRDPRFTSHFTKALCAQLGVNQNVSTAYHPQTDGLSERKNQWVEQYLRLLTSNQQEDWARWLPVATAVHNHAVNSTTKVAPIEALLGYHPRLDHSSPITSPNPRVETRKETAFQKREQAKEALNRVASQAPSAVYEQGDRVWLEATHLALPYQSPKLAPKRHGPFTITKKVSPVAYQLHLPAAWTIHDVFHASLLSPYQETDQHGVNFTRPPPDLVQGGEEYEVESISAHRHYGRGKQLQYLIKWKGYPEADNTWEPAGQVFAPELIKRYHARHPLEEDKRTRTSRRVAIRSSLFPSWPPPPLTFSSTLRLPPRRRDLSNPRRPTPPSTASWPRDPHHLARRSTRSTPMARSSPPKLRSFWQRRLHRPRSTGWTATRSISAPTNNSTKASTTPTRRPWTAPPLRCEPSASASTSWKDAWRSPRRATPPPLPTQSTPMGLSRTTAEPPTSSPTSTASSTRSATSAASPGPDWSKAPWAPRMISGTSRSCTRNPPSSPTTQWTWSHTGSSGAYPPTPPPTTPSSPPSKPSTTGGCPPTPSATTTPMGLWRTSKLRSASSRPRKTPSPYSSAPATTAWLERTWGSGSPPSKPSPPSSSRGRARPSSPPAPVSQPVVGLWSSRRVMLPALRRVPFQAREARAHVSSGANRSPGADRWFSMTRYRLA